jgi:hypothetical protein
MSESQRVQRWRQRLEAEGLEALTIWLPADEKARLKDLAAAWRCSLSEVIRHACAQYDPGLPPRLGDSTDTLPSRHSTITDAEQVRTLITEMLAQYQQNAPREHPAATLSQSLGALEPDAAPVPAKTRRPPAYAKGEVQAIALVATTQEPGLTNAEYAKRTGVPAPQLHVAFMALVRKGKVRKDGVSFGPAEMPLGV